jgi:diphthine synthase
MIGIGLGDSKDITLKGLEAIKKSEIIFLEGYTSTLGCSIEDLEKLYGKTITPANRNLVESDSDVILEPALTQNVSFLVVGDVFGATTHTDLYIRAKEKGIKTIVINNASILNAIGITGLELYRFGKTTSIVFDDDNWLPETPYYSIKENLEHGLHTLCLLDIKVAESSKENLKKRIHKPEPARFMTIKQAIEILKKLEEKQKGNIITNDTLIVGVARLGRDNFTIKSGKLSEIENKNFGDPLHSLIIPGKLHDIEKEMLDLWK